MVTIAIVMIIIWAESGDLAGPTQSSEKKESGGGDCQDLDPNKLGCAKYAALGYCNNPYLVANCKKTCKLC